ncbi:pyridine nucleotide-disulfide oxidoreductase [Altererythrobacter sp. B11]|uniref:NAD(P)/FAD-dependent oxidoreductase n=1 Tax=Altererythrobacter sp. B11 TaxID=2060312 RepID=UPI000DC7180C|nr:FAD/NAD(P)-binding oxidoreductase [Altererythrobacter sp. B11]BBC70984.1 pyridine nucleotide-disulfide oxidoreductase [Altererythrobacter sp. B11]
MAEAHVVILGAGLGGTIAAYEIRQALQDSARVTVVNKGEDYWFVPSNPWVAVGWREPEALRVHLPPVMAKHGIAFTGVRAKRVDPANNRLELNDGTTLDYDYLVIATGPDLAFDEIEGFGPEGFTHSVCETRHAAAAHAAFEDLCLNPGPIVVGAVQGASCYGPAYETAMILDTELKRRQIRDRVPITFITPEPYIGHLGLDGVGDTKGLLESEMRQRHIKWITNARVTKVEQGLCHVEEVDEDGALKRTHDLPFGWAMMLPAFRGVPALMGLEGLVNPRGFVLTDRHQRNPAYPNIFGLGVCIAIPPVAPTPLPVGVPKTGFMIESMVTAITRNLQEIMAGGEPTHEASWNAICLADFGDGGVAFVAKPQIPPRNTNWASEGKWVHLAKIGFEKYFLRKIRRGESEPFYEKLALHVLGVKKLRFD